MKFQTAVVCQIVRLPRVIRISPSNSGFFNAHIGNAGAPSFSSVLSIGSAVRKRGRGIDARYINSFAHEFRISSCWRAAAAFKKRWVRGEIFGRELHARWKSNGRPDRLSDRPIAVSGRNRRYRRTSPRQETSGRCASIDAEFRHREEDSRCLSYAPYCSWNDKWLFHYRVT